MSMTSPLQLCDLEPSGLSGHGDILRKTPSVLGGTSLKLSEGNESPLLEAHPGSPIDLSGRRPSLSATLAARRPYKLQGEGLVRSPLQSKKENCIITGGVVAKLSSVAPSSLEVRDDECVKVPKTKMLAASQPFFIPAKVPEHQVVHNLPSPIDDGIFIDTAMETAMDFHFEEDNGLWISAIPIAHESRSSISTNTTGTSTLVEDKYCTGSLTVDTCIASSATSVLSSTASIASATTTNSDIYGWEEELERKSSMETHGYRYRDVERRLPSGGRTMGPRLRVEPDFKRPDGKRKSLLHRVLNLSRRGTEEPPIPMIPTRSPLPTSAAC